MEILSFIGIIIFLYIIHFYFRYYTRPNPLPGPFPLPFIGTILQIGLNPRKWAEKNLDDSIDMWEFYVGPFRVVIVCDAKYVDKIYLSYRDTNRLYRESKFSNRKIAAYDEFGISKGVIFNGVFHKWKRLRQFVTKVLMSKKYHYGFINSVQEIFKEYENQWDKNDVVTLDISSWVSYYKTKLTITTVIGQPLYNLSSFESISKAASEYIAMMLFVILIPKFISRIVMSIGFRNMKKSSIFLNGTMHEIILKRRNEIKNGSPTNFNLLDLLLISNSSNDSDEYIEGEKPMDDDEIEINLVEITAVSIDTTSSTFCFIIYNVAKNPSIYKKLRAQILEVFGSNTNSMVTYEDLERCYYIDALIKETLRHSNPAPYVLRVLDGYESTDKIHWPSGTWFFVDNHRIMNNSNYWNEPTYFNPDRFLSKEHGGTDEFNNICKNGY
ncbi:15919_t:CDS:2 [Dentiscutata erythropus]|uniref:15919_t:CDS:1 n=1 Tax=Dentiscutata erythropus TaxID=1348616 RepID=A0A9N8VJ48_9GLOM|nr:15919_t:CDS:2 [Dentiscutata erythropus]